MGSLLLRRREMMLAAAQPTPPIVCPYITNGLIFWLDGIEKGGVSGQWKDLIGGKIFTLNNCTFNTDSVSFNGSSSYGVYAGKISDNWQNETIEITRKENTPTGACFVSPAGSTTPIGIGFIMNSGKTECSIQLDGTSVPRVNIGGRWNRASINANVRIIDAVLEGTGTNDSWGKNSSANTYIGCRYVSSFSRYYSGNLCSIRIYNRKLTADEMKANQAVDATRFNL